MQASAHAQRGHPHIHKAESLPFSPVRADIWALSHTLSSTHSRFLAHNLNTPLVRSPWRDLSPLLAPPLTPSSPSLPPPPRSPLLPPNFPSFSTLAAAPSPSPPVFCARSLLTRSSASTSTAKSNTKPATPVRSVPGPRRLAFVFAGSHPAEGLTCTLSVDDFWI
eukprot:912993-Rhodomonas_salina.1